MPTVFTHVRGEARQVDRGATGEQRLAVDPCRAVPAGETIEADSRSIEVVMPAPSPPASSRPSPPGVVTPGPGHRRSHRTLLSLLEVGLAVAMVAFRAPLPAVVLTLLALVSLLVRREGLATLGLRPLAHPRRQVLHIVLLTLAWTTVVFLIVMPATEHLTGSAQDTSEFAALEGNLPRLLLFLGLSWTLAAVVEELAFRGYLLTRVTDVVGSSVLARAAGVVGVALLFAVIHTEQGATGMVLVFADAVFFGVLRYAYGSLWAAVVAHGVSNTVGMTAFFLLGPFGAPW